jgi:osmotically-inducible protein OsmY
MKKCNYYCLLGIILCCISSLLFANTVTETTRDLALENKAKLAMFLKKGVPSANIKTHADKGVLQIAGYVNNKNELTAVENAIKEYLKQDNTKIINNVKVCNDKSNSMEDDKLAKHVREHLEQFNYPTKDIGIQVKNKHVMLSGFVDKEVNIDEAVKVAQEVPTVLEVDNYLMHKQY